MSKSIADVIDKYGFCMIHPKGTSMFPTLRGDNEVYIIRPEFPLKVLDVPVYERESGELVMHRILDIDEQGYVCCGDNQWMLEYGITDDMIIGVLDSWYKGKRKHTVRDSSYLRYVRFWCKSLKRRRFILRFCHKYIQIKYFVISVFRKLFGKKSEK